MFHNATSNIKMKSQLQKSDISDATAHHCSQKCFYISLIFASFQHFVVNINRKKTDTVKGYTKSLKKQYCLWSREKLNILPCMAYCICDDCSYFLSSLSLCPLLLSSSPPLIMYFPYCFLSSFSQSRTMLQHRPGGCLAKQVFPIFMAHYIPEQCTRRQIQYITIYYIT